MTVTEVAAAAARLSRRHPDSPTFSEASGGQDVIATAQQFRRRLLAREEQAASRMLEVWADTRAVISKELERLHQAIKGAVARGVEPNIGWLQSQQQWTELLQAANRNVAEFARHAERITVDAQQHAIGAAQDDTRRLIADQLAQTPFGVVQVDPSAQVAQMVGQTQAGPLADLLGSLAPETSRKLADELTQGVAVGRNPRTTARRLRRVVDFPRHRAETIARTETLRAYRETSRAVYTANRDVLDGVTWHAELDHTTCAVCWAMHGTVMPADETFATHPRCRCTTTPVVKPWEDLGVTGLEDDVPVLTPGPELFARQPASVQRRVLGPGKHSLYANGDMDLADLVGFRVDPQWGPVRFEKALRDLMPAA